MSLRAASHPSFNGQLVVLSDDPRLSAARGNYQFDVADPATVWSIEHDLGFDPAGIVVVDSDGYQRDGFGVQYLIQGLSLRLSFDVAIAGTAHLS